MSDSFLIGYHRRADLEALVVEDASDEMVEDAFAAPVEFDHLLIRSSSSG